MTENDVEAALALTSAGFQSLGAEPQVAGSALLHLRRWLEGWHFQAWQPQLQALIESGRWAILLDCFYRELPFGTGGRRGPVGPGPNRFNAWTLGTSVQGHVQWLRQRFGPGPLEVVVGYDVRRFHDLRAELVPGVPDPVRGLGSRDFALVAAEVYAAADIRVHLPPEESFLSTPELGFAIRRLGAVAGLQVTASHNPPDDNGGKLYIHSGGQAVPPEDEALGRLVEQVERVERMSLDRARAAGLVVDLDPGLQEAYIQLNLSCSRDPSARSTRVVFTPLHGTGRRTVLPLLERAGFPVELEPTQAEPDGSFPAVPFRAPNPEVFDTLEAAIRHADEVGADLVMACDPDADRLGLAAREREDAQGNRLWRFFNGNEIGALVCHHALSSPRTAQPLVLKTEVTSRLVERVARARGARVVGHLPVGFKYIGEALDLIETTGHLGEIEARLEDFVAGVEESHGVLVTPELRDKDAAGGALLLAELASIEARAGRSLGDTLAGLWQEVGYVRNELLSAVLRGASGRQRIEAMQRSLRRSPFEQIGGRKVLAFHDRQDPRGPFGPIRSETDRASRDMLVFELEGEARILLRPSGTEPKTKVYAEICSPPGELGRLGRLEIDRACRSLAEEALLGMLARVDLHPPRWVLAASDLMSIDHKLHLAEEVLPGLLERLEQGLPLAEAAAWLDVRIASYGADPRALIRGAMQAWAATSDHPQAPVVVSFVR